MTIIASGFSRLIHFFLETNPYSPLILFDNRDEVFERPTSGAHWWPNTNIYAPQDLNKIERGTWIGVTKTGRFAVLVNLYEDEKQYSQVSRGSLPRLFLESGASPEDWISNIKESHSDILSESGGFVLLVGTVQKDPDGNNWTSRMQTVSNRETTLPGTEKTLSVSNGADSSWVKTQDALKMFQSILTVEDHDRVVQEGFRLLSHRQPSPPLKRQDLRKHIFIPRMLVESGESYGTRNQVVIVVDNSGQLTYSEIDIETNARTTEYIQIN